MKYLNLLLAIAFISSCQQVKTPIQPDSINPIIGNISYIEKFGEQPTDQSDENLRIKTHLAYVENLLRNKNTDHLSNNQLAKRNTLLDYLQAYHEAGQFPKNYDHKNERKPCFIDKDKNICAVGYLVEQSAGLQAAEKINSDYQYATIHEMESPLLEDWIDHSGLSKQEVAIIQPTYSNPRNSNYIGYRYGVPSSVLSLTNIGLSTASIVNWNNPEYSKNYARVGMASGVLTLGYEFLYGASTFRNAKTDYQKKLSNTNLVTGVLALGVNGFRLLNYKKKKDKKISWDFNIQPELNQEPLYNFALLKKL